MSNGAGVGSRTMLSWVGFSIGTGEEPVSAKGETWVVGGLELMTEELETWVVGVLELGTGGSGSAMLAMSACTCSANMSRGSSLASVVVAGVDTVALVV